MGAFEVHPLVFLRFRGCRGPWDRCPQCCGSQHSLPSDQLSLNTWDTGSPRAAEAQEPQLGDSAQALVWVLGFSSLQKHAPNIRGLETHAGDRSPAGSSETCPAAPG